MEDISDRFILEKYRTQWSHLKFIFIPFMVLMVIIGLGIEFQSYLPEQLSSVVSSALVIGYAIIVFSLPWWLKKSKIACYRSLIFKEGKIILFDTKRHSIVTKAGVANLKAIPGKFHYTIFARFSGGTFRAPLITIQFSNDKTYHIGVQGCSLEWGDEVPRIRRPDYMLPVDRWPDLASLLGLNDQLVKVTDARVR